MRDAIIDLYDGLYARKFNLTKGNDLLISEALEYGIEGRVLDVGVGEGLQSILLAQSGLEVDAIDLSPVGIGRLRRYAQESQLSISAAVADVCEYELRSQYGAVVACNVLKYIPRTQFQEVISKLQRHTVRGGLHLLRMQAESPFWKYRYPEAQHLVPFDPELIDELYAGWRLMYHEVFEALVPINAGKPMHLPDRYINLMLQKP